MELAVIEQYFNDFFATIDNDQVSFELFYATFPYKELTNISSFETYFDEFPFNTITKQLHTEPDFQMYYDEFEKCAQADKEAIRKYNPDLNIWESIGLGTYELKHCQFLSWLFDPRGEHGQQDLFLRCFLEEIECLSIYNGNQMFSVTREDHVGEFGRLDISIGNSQFWLIIEVKINAAEQIDQIPRYAEYLKKRSEWRNIPISNCKIVYLTPDRRPSSDRTSEIICIDWNTVSHALELFCDKCINTEVTNLVHQYRTFLNKKDLVCP